MPESQHASIASNPNKPGKSPIGRRYHRDALLAVLRILGIIGEDVAAVFAATVKLRGDRQGADERELPMEAMAEALGLDGQSLRQRLIAVDDSFAQTFSLNLLDPLWRRAALATDPAERGFDHRTAALFAGDCDEPSGGVLDIHDRLLLGRSFIDLLDNPHSIVAPSALHPVLDATGRHWMTVVSALSQKGESAHLAIRRSSQSARNVADLAAHVEAIGATLRVLRGGRDDVMAAILRAELHADGPQVILIERDLLTKAVSTDEDGFDESIPRHDLGGSELATSPPAWLAACRGITLWTVPIDGKLSAAAASWIGACIGPLKHDRAWARSIVADHIGTGITDPQSSAGVRALAQRIEDPRDAAAVAGVARAMAAEGSITTDEALVVLATSFSDRPPKLVPSVSRFDRRLLVCGREAHRLLERAREAASNGARVLAHGAPGGGKSAFVRELALGMAGGGLSSAGGGPIRVVTPADFLARGWGSTERLVRDLWRRAADEGEILIADEFEVICGRRVPGDMSNNALLIRSLTDEWLRALDEHPSVPLLATTNDIAIDPAALRRFAFVLEFGDKLSAAQEKLAWASILEREPPPRWKACGAAVADFVLARQRCRMLGLVQATDLQEAIMAAKAARVGVESRVAAPVRTIGTRH